MAAGPFTLYLANLDDLRLQDLAGAALRMSLHTSAYVPNGGTSGHAVSADLSNELPTGGGYTAGGIALTGASVTAIANGWKFSTGNAEWTASGAGIPEWRYAVLRVLGSLWGKTNPLIGYLLGETGGNVPAVVADQPLRIECPSGGWFDLIRS